MNQLLPCPCKECDRIKCKVKRTNCSEYMKFKADLAVVTEKRRKEAQAFLCGSTYDNYTYVKGR